MAPSLQQQQQQQQHMMLTGVRVACRSLASIDALPHVAALLDEFLDYSTKWSLVKATSSRDLRLLNRVIAAVQADKYTRHAVVDLEMLMHVRAAMRIAARNDVLPAIELLLPLYPGVLDEKMIENASENGHLHVLLRIYKHLPQSAHGWFESNDFLNAAIANGHLEVVKWLFSMRTTDCGMPAMHRAAVHGHLEIVQWLHEHSKAGCNDEIINYAAEANRLSVVQFLHANRTEGCSVKAINGAEENGHLEVVQWLLENRKEGMTAKVEKAAENGHLEVLRWLDEHCRNSTPNGLWTSMRTNPRAIRTHVTCAAYDKLEVLQWVFRHYAHVLGHSADALHNRHFHIAQWLSTR